jgi:hypothetical protein
LLISFLHRVGMRENAALAQAQPRRPGDYLMIPGEITGGSAGIVYIVDMTNAKLSAMTYDENNHRLVSMRSVDLSQVFQRAAGQPQPPQQQPQPRGGGNR